MSRVCAWKKLENLSFEAGRSALTINAIEGGKFLVVAGGEDGPRTTLCAEKSAALVNLEEGSTRLLEHGFSLLGHSSAVVQEKLYVFGGRQGGRLGESEESGALWRLEGEQFSEVRVTSEARPCARSFQASAASGAFFFVYGGCTGHDRLSDLWAFDTTTGEWEELSGNGCPAGVRGGATLHATRDAVYVLFGFNGGELATLWKFDRAAKTWAQLPEGPAARSVTPSCSVGDALLLFSGEATPATDGHAGAGTFHSDAWLFQDEKWTAMHYEAGTGPEPRGWTQMTPLSSTSAILYGGLSSSNERLCDFWLLSWE